MAGLGVLGAGVLAIPRHAPVGVFDEGAALYGGLRLLHGELPYRDFWTTYGPGQYATLAAVFAAFGPSVGAARAWDIAMRALLALALYALARAASGRAAALVCWGGVIALLAQPGQALIGPPPALLFSVVAVLAALAAGPELGARAAAGAGLAVGLAFLYRPDFGVVAWGTSLVTLAALAAARPRPWAPRPLVRALAAHTGGLAMVLLPAAVAALSLVGGAALWQHLVTYPAQLAPLRGSSRPRFLVHPFYVLQASLETLLEPSFIAHRWFHSYAPPALYAGAIAVLGLGWRALGRGEGDARRRAALAGAITLGAGLVPYALLSADWAHTWPTVSLALVVGAALASAVWRAPLGRGARAGLCALATAGALAVALPPASVAIRAARQNPPLACASAIPRASCAALEPDREAALARVRAIVPPGEPIFVGLGRHDQIYINDVSFYFLAERESPTRFHELPPALATAAAGQESIRAALEAGGVRHVVLWSRYDGFVPPGARLRVSGATRLDEYLHERFELRERLGHYALWQRR